jgi:hypothetical protein
MPLTPTTLGPDRSRNREFSEARVINIQSVPPKIYIHVYNSHVNNDRILYFRSIGVVCSQMIMRIDYYW